MTSKINHGQVQSQLPKCYCSPACVSQDEGARCRIKSDASIRLLNPPATRLRHARASYNGCDWHPIAHEAQLPPEASARYVTHLHTLSLCLVLDCIRLLTYGTAQQAAVGKTDSIGPDSDVAMLNWCGSAISP